MATAAADVWSLGATAYHALAGTPPYEVGDNLMGALYRIVHEEPPHLANAGWLGVLLDNTMTKDPTDRWPMAEVRDFLAGGPVGAPTYVERADTRTVAVARDAPPPGSPAPGPRPPRRTAPRSLPPAPPPPTPAAHRRGPSGAVIGVLLGLLVVLLFLLFACFFGAFDNQDDPRTTPPRRRRAPRTRRSGGHAVQPVRGSRGPRRADAGIHHRLRRLAVDDPRTSWQMLTPDFQKASGGFGNYKKFWDQWSSAIPANIEADPDALTGHLRHHLHP
jgi:serine/threonine protein kinase